MNFFDKYFVFSHSEKKGILLFLIIIFLLCFVYWLIPRYFAPKPTDYSATIKKMKLAELEHAEEVATAKFLFNPNTISKDSLVLLGFSSKQAWNLINFRKKVKPFGKKEELRKLYAMTDSLFNSIESFVELDNLEKKESRPKNKLKSVEKELFSFDPNSISLDSLKLLGLSSKTAQTLIRFRDKSGGFKSKSDLKKVFGLSEKQLEELDAFIQITELPIQRKKERLVAIDLNKADKSELMAAKGIGNAFSDRIIEFRERIGGFSSISQLAEVYGIDEDWLLSYQYQFVADKEDVQKININTITFKELLRHPYFSYSQTQLIINYREQHGNFNSVEQIREINLIKPKHYRKIAPYLSIQ